ncbi:MAG: DUF4129 domain-containing protein [Bifidobacteriaceae bacterium]|nr:DUF4129 domain-containing protein [Bifidobacteriaceae bacterium]
MTAFPTPPLDPAPDEARRWLEDELSKAVYHAPDSLMERIWHWVQDLLGRGMDVGALPPWQALAAGLGLAAAVVLIAWRLAGPVRRRIAARRPHAVLNGETRSAAELRAAASSRANDQNWRHACVLAFQALARRLEERAILEPQPGRTADELAHDAARVLPALGDSLRWAAGQFDAVAYGNGRGDADAYRSLDQLYERAEQTKPTQLGPAADAAPDAVPPAATLARAGAGQVAP